MPEKPSRREWVVEPGFDAEGNLVSELSAQLAYLLADLAVVVARVGGVISVGADRAEVTPGVFETVRAAVAWESFAPARRLPREAPPAESQVEPEIENPEPVADAEPALAATG